MTRCGIAVLALAVMSVALFSGSNAIAAKEPGWPGSILVRPDGLFEKNIGQASPSTLYRGRFGTLDVAIERDGSLMARTRSGAAIRVHTEGRAESGTIEPLEVVEFRTNYLKGRDTSKYIVDVPHFRKLRVPELYPGIDLVYRADQGNLEFDFLVSAHADPKRIGMRIEGASSLRIDEHGDLGIVNGQAVIRQRKPVAYQLKDGIRTEISCEYRLLSDRTVAFALGPYDPSRELVIDPVVDYSSYLGGASADSTTGVRVGTDGYIYVVGTTSSSNFPTASAFDSSLGGASDVFVAKINPATGKAVYATYLGGGNADSASAIAVDVSGSVYVTGIAGSRFPTTSGAYQTSASGTYGFVSKLSAAGNSLVYSTLLAGTRPLAIEVDSQGRALITGSAGSSFLTTAGAYRTAYAGGTGAIDTTSQGDAFVVMLNATGTGAAFATFFGGGGTEEARGIGVDSSGRIIIGGVTDSANLPVATPYQGALAGATDAFIAMLSATGAALVSATYYGGTGSDQITSLAIDPYGNVVVAGNTTSADLPTLNAILPVSALAPVYTNAFTGQPAYQKGFVAKFAQAPYQLSFSTFTAGRIDCCDTADSIAVDAAGDIYVSGDTKVDQFNDFVSINPFVTNGTVRSRYGATDQDAIYGASYTRDGRELRYQSYMAPCAFNTTCERTVVAARAAGQAVLGGATYADWLPITAANTDAVSGSPNTATDAFVMTVAVEVPTLALNSSASTAVAGSSVTLRATSYAGGGGTVSFLDGSTTLGTASLVEGIAQLTMSFPAGVHRLTATLGTSVTPTILLPISATTGTCP